jgi:hypothetical protein
VVEADGQVEVSVGYMDPGRWIKVVRRIHTQCVSEAKAGLKKTMGTSLDRM